MDGSGWGTAVMKTLIIASLCLGAFVIQSPLFGIGPSEAQIAPPEALITRSKNIVLFRITDAKYNRGGVIYGYQVIRVLKGSESAGNRGDIRGSIQDLFSMEIYRDHEDLRFWDVGIGRSKVGTDGKIRPNFSVGTEYLAFLDPPYHIKSFEIVRVFDGTREENDKWFSFVVETIQQQAGK